MHFQRKLVGGGLLTLLLLLVSGCADSAGGGDGGDGGDAIKIGVIFAQTGDVSALGVSARAGALSAVDYVNANGGVDGRDLEVEFCDDGGDVARVATCTRQMIDQGVVAVVGPITSPLSLVAAPLLGAAEIPQFAVASATALTDPVQPFLFRASSGAQEEMELLSDYLESEGIERVALLTDTGANGQDNVRILGELLPAAGIEVSAAETYDLDDTDMTAQLTKINGTDAEVLLSPGSVQQIAVIANNRASLGMTMPHLSAAGISTDAFIELAGQDAEGIRCLAWKVSNFDRLEPEDPLYEPISLFVDNFTEDIAPDQFSGIAWDTVMMLTEAMSGLDDPTDSVAIRDAIEGLDAYVGTSAVWDYTPDNHRGNDTSGFAFAELTNGEFVPLDGAGG